MSYHIIEWMRGWCHQVGVNTLNLQIHRTGLTNGFVNASDEYNEIKRKLFGIPEIDELLSFEHQKNILRLNFLQKLHFRSCNGHN